MIAPEDFFVDGNIYARLQKSLCEAKLECFDVDSFNYKKLSEIYAARFDTVIFVPMEDIGTMSFLESIFDLSEEVVSDLQHSFRVAPIANRAYSDTAMRLTFMRARLLGKLGLKTTGSNNLPVMEVWKQHEAANSAIVAKATSFRNLPANEKVIQFPQRVWRKLLRLSHWRFFLQDGVDIILPYKKYKLPQHINLNDGLVDENRLFVTSVRENAIDSGAEINRTLQSNP